MLSLLCICRFRLLMLNQLLLHNTTTVERLRAQAHIKLVQQQSASNTSLPRNPFEMKWWHNVAYLLCRPEGLDWIEASEYATEDARTLNPGVLYEWEHKRSSAAQNGITVTRTRVEVDEDPEDRYAGQEIHLQRDQNGGLGPAPMRSSFESANEKIESRRASHSEE